MPLHRSRSPPIAPQTSDRDDRCRSSARAVCEAASVASNSSAPALSPPSARAAAGLVARCASLWQHRAAVSIYVLPCEVHELIFLALDADTLLRSCPRVCKLWASLLHPHSSLWTRLYKRDQHRWRTFGNQLLRLHRDAAASALAANTTASRAATLGRFDWRALYALHHLENAQHLDRAMERLGLSDSAAASAAGSALSTAAQSRAAEAVGRRPMLLQRLVVPRPAAVPRILVFSQRLGGLAKRMVYAALWSSNSPFRHTRLYPGIEGIGSGFGLRVRDRELALAAMYRFHTGASTGAGAAAATAAAGAPGAPAPAPAPALAPAAVPVAAPAAPAAPAAAPGAAPSVAWPLAEILGGVAGGPALSPAAAAALNTRWKRFMRAMAGFIYVIELSTLNWELARAELRSLLSAEYDVPADAPLLVLVLNNSSSSSSSSSADDDDDSVSPLPTSSAAASSGVSAAAPLLLTPVPPAASTNFTAAAVAHRLRLTSDHVARPWSVRFGCIDSFEGMGEAISWLAEQSGL